ncbi:MAG TPA: acyltransferase [Polyangiaceae bacterium]|nr:acyltransferase [Polyangiaceae bacterium]
MSVQEGFAEPTGQDRDRSPLLGTPTDAEGPIRLAYLDGLRALAAGYVVLFHAFPGFLAPQLIGPWRLFKRAFAYGHEAVAIFIVLSGYCLMLPLVRKDPARLQIAFGRFVKRRAKRILPPYFAAVVGSMALLASVPLLRRSGSGTIWDDSLPGLEPGSLVSHALVVHNWFPKYAYQLNGPLWSVASEWQIYFFFPLVLLPLWRRLGMPGALLGAAALGYAPLWFAPAGARVAIPWYLLLFTFGMAAASIGFAFHELERRLRTRVAWGWLSGGLWLACVVFSNVAATLWFSLKPLVDPLIGLSTAALLTHLTRQGIAGRRSRLLTLLESPPLVALGHFSYSLYLTHLPVLALCYFGLRGLKLSGASLMLGLPLLGGLASLVVAYAFHLVFERPFMKRA